MHKTTLLFVTIALILGNAQSTRAHGSHGPSVAQTPRITSIATKKVRPRIIAQGVSSRMQLRSAAARNYRLRKQRERQHAVSPSPRIPVMQPAIAASDATPNHKFIADEAVKQIPKKCQGTLKHFHVRYDNPNHRGLGGKSTMILTGHAPDPEYRALFFHEYGHVLDLGCLVGSIRSGETRFLDGNEMMYQDDPSVSFYQISWSDAKTMKPGQTRQDFVSGYAMSDVYEDFAESFTYYALHRETFRQRAAQNSTLATKYRWFQTYLPEFDAVGKYGHKWDGTVPWDTTRLEYEWAPVVKVRQG